jgi:hypothetical protein
MYMNFIVNLSSKKPLTTDPIFFARRLFMEFRGCLVESAHQTGSTIVANVMIVGSKEPMTAAQIRDMLSIVFDRHPDVTLGAVGLSSTHGTVSKILERRN